MKIYEKYKYYTTGLPIPLRCSVMLNIIFLFTIIFFTITLNNQGKIITELSKTNDDLKTNVDNVVNTGIILQRQYRNIEDRLINIEQQLGIKYDVEPVLFRSSFASSKEK